MVKVIASCLWATSILAACNLPPPAKGTGGVTLTTGLDSGAEAQATPVSASEAGLETDADATDASASPATDNGYADVDAGSPEAAADAMTDGGASPDAAMVSCAKAVDIVCSDYKSTNIAIAGIDGTTLSDSFVSSGTVAPGLTLALSGDVDVPLVAPASGRVVLIDRYGTNVLTWMDLTKATVLAQLPVGTGFEANPHDYIEVDSTRAFVSRYGSNPTPGQQPFDHGGDLLVVDTSKFAITASIAIPEENPALQPCPDTMNWLGADVVVTLGRISADFMTVGDGRFIGVSPATNAIDWTVTVTGLQTCGRVVVSPSGTRAAIACSSTANAETGEFDLSQSDIVVYDATMTPPKEVKRLGVATALGSAVQPQIAFASEDVLLALTYGGNATAGDTVISVSATTGAVTMLGAATMSYAFGGVVCSPGCGDVCLVGDAERNALRRWQMSSGALTPLADVTVDPTVGLPPRDIGGL
jgi:hypothetical protein